MLTTMVGLLAAAVAWFLWERSHRKTGEMRGGIHEDIVLPHEQAWELYHNDFSLCSKKTRVCLAELGIDYKSHHVDLIETGSYENISRHFLKVNPGALVPVLVHNGHPIYESHEQLAYAAAHSENPSALVPEDDQRRAVMERWVHLSSLIDPLRRMQETAGNAVPGLTMPIFAAMVEHIPARRILVGLLFHWSRVRPLLFLTMKLLGVARFQALKPLVSMMRSSRRLMHGHLDALEQALGDSGGPWIVGDRFTLADVGMMVIFERLAEVDWLDTFLTADRPRVVAYWQALQARPSYAAAIEAFGHPLVTKGTSRIVELKKSNPTFRDALLGGTPNP